MAIDSSIIIIEYNSLEEIRSLVDRVEALLGQEGYEIIVSSNSMYPEEKRNDILQACPDLRWIFNERNGGFAYGMNRGIAVAKGEIVTICNPDVTILEGYADAVQYMKTHPAVGAIGPRIVDADGNVQDSCRPFLTLPRFVKRQLARLSSHREVILEKDFDYSACQPVPWVIGAFIMARKSAVEAVGLLDEKYFMYNEDMDWCTRFWKNGQPVYYYPALSVRYKGTRAARRKLKYAWIFLRSNLRYWCLYGFFRNRYEKTVRPEL